MSLQTRNEAYNWNRFSLLIFDEVHHLVNDHPYRIFMGHLREWARVRGTGLRCQLLGLSASLTYEVDPLAIQNKLQALQRDLNIEKMIVPTVDELAEGGYNLPDDNDFETDFSQSEVPSGESSLELTERIMRTPESTRISFIRRISSSRE